MDQKSSRVFVRSVVEHLAKSIKSFDDTKPEIIVTEIEDHLKMIKMATGMKKPTKKKKKNNNKTKAANLLAKLEATVPATSGIQSS